MAINLCIFTGNLVRDPELTNFANGNKKVKICIAVQGRKYKKQSGEEVNECEFPECFGWEGQAETIEKFFKKGDPIEVHCKYKLESWEKDGQKHYKPTFLIKEFFFPPRGGNGNKQKDEVDEEAPPTPAKTSPAKKSSKPAQDNDSDIPF